MIKFLFFASSSLRISQNSIKTNTSVVNRINFERQNDFTKNLKEINFRVKTSTANYHQAKKTNHAKITEFRGLYVCFFIESQVDC